MNAEMVSRLMSLIPERAPRAQLGAAFALEGCTCRYPDRIALVSKFLHWMTPLESLSNEDQQVLGLRNALGRPIHASDLEEELDAEELAPEGLRDETPPEPRELEAELI